MLYKNNLLFSLIIFLGTVCSIVSCSKESPKGISHHRGALNSSIQDIKNVYSYYDGADVPLAFDSAFKEINISGILISDAASGNLPSGYLIVQDQSAGIVIILSDPKADIPFAQGDSVQVNVVNGTLTKVDGNMAITGIHLSDISQIGEGSVTPQAVSLKVLSNNFKAFNEKLVRITLADLLPEPEPGEKYSGGKILSDGSASTGDIILYTFSSSDLANIEAKANATYVGIAMYGMGEDGDKNEMQIWLRNEADIKETHVVPMNTPIVITGFLANPYGRDEPVPGFVKHGVVHTGGYEYVQFMALEDIDFSKTPYSVVICNNKWVQKKIWAAGNTNTFKFDLTKGFAKQGSFFYVGGSAKVIASYVNDRGESTDISDANWIRSIPVNIKGGGLAGDGFGASTGALMGNNSPADGIAVFEGTEVTASSVPVDAVFFNPPAGTAFRPNLNRGYTIPKSDLYNPVNPETGEPQPFFGQGTNTFAVEGAGGENVFTLMGGIASKNGWLSPRKPTLKKLNFNSVLADIEKGKGVTIYRK